MAKGHRGCGEEWREDGEGWERGQQEKMVFFVSLVSVDITGFDIGQSPWAQW